VAVRILRLRVAIWRALRPFLCSVREPTVWSKTPHGGRNAENEILVRMFLIRLARPSLVARASYFSKLEDLDAIGFS
jgi:hypothetical protein